MKGIFLLFFSLLLLSSCSFLEPEYKGDEKFELIGIEGRKVSLKAGATVYNPNGYTIKLMPSDFDLYIDNVKIGILHLDEKVKMKGKENTEIYAPLTITVKEGMLFKLMALAGKGEVDVQLKGKLKAGVFIFFKKFDVKEVKTINTSLFNR